MSEYRIQRPARHIRGHFKDVMTEKEKNASMDEKKKKNRKKNITINQTALERINCDVREQTFCERACQHSFLISVGVSVIGRLGLYFVGPGVKINDNIIATFCWTEIFFKT